MPSRAVLIGPLAGRMNRADAHVLSECSDNNNSCSHHDAHIATATGCDLDARRRAPTSLAGNSLQPTARQQQGGGGIPSFQCNGPLP